MGGREFLGTETVGTFLIASPIVLEGGAWLGRVRGRRVYYDTGGGLRGCYATPEYRSTGETVPASDGLTGLVDTVAGYIRNSDIWMKILARSSRDRRTVWEGLKVQKSPNSVGEHEMRVSPAGIVFGKYDTAGPLLRADVHEEEPQVFVMVREPRGRKRLLYDTVGDDVGDRSVGEMCAALRPHIGRQVSLAFRRRHLISISAPYQSASGPDLERERVVYSWGDSGGKPVSGRTATLLSAGLMCFQSKKN